MKTIHIAYLSIFFILLLNTRSSNAQEIKDARHWKTCFKKQCIPSSAIYELENHSDWKIYFKIVNPGKYFRKTDISLGRKDPSRGLILTARHDDFLILAYHHTAFTMHTHVILLKQDNKSYHIVKSIYAENNIKNIEEIVEQLRNTVENPKVNEY